LLSFAALLMGKPTPKGARGQARRGTDAMKASLGVPEALELIFRQHARGRAGGQKVLDDREYLHLEVEVRAGTGASLRRCTRARTTTYATAPRAAPPEEPA
jgi:hypothetical protein